MPKKKVVVKKKPVKKQKAVDFEEEEEELDEDQIGADDEVDEVGMENVGKGEEEN